MILKKLLPWFATSALLGMAASLPAADAPAPATTLRVTTLQCDHDTDPLGVDVAAPRLSWQVESNERGQKQTAWQILAASSPELLTQDHGDVWDSGRIASDATTDIPYAGSRLSSLQQVFWKVRGWDRDGKSTAWSSAATWTMGVLRPADWAGTWIVAPGMTESLLLRSEFSVKPGLRRALANVSGLGQYEMYFNGAKVGADVLTPGWTNYESTILYDTLDVTALLHEGPNATGLFLGNGIYDVVRRDRFAKFLGFFGPQRAILSLSLEYNDGTVDYFGTDESWRVQPGPITFGTIYGGEDYDARLRPPGWNKAGFDDHLWPHAVAMIRPSGTLRGHSEAAPPIRVIEIRQPVAVHPNADGSILYDLGQNASYMPRIRVAGPAGSTVRLTPSEIINADGSLNRGTMGGTDRGISWWQYTKATDEEETWSPSFCYIGCRYLKAEFFPAGEAAPSTAATPPADADKSKLPHLVAVEGQVVHSTSSPAGTFATSNTLLNKIRDLVRWAISSNMMSLLTDCPHREKLGWLDDVHLVGPSVRYEFDTARLFDKITRDMAEAQITEGEDKGLIPNIAPEYTKFKGDYRDAAEWGSAFLDVPWQQYQFTGDLELLRTNYTAMKNYFAYLEKGAKDGIVSDGLGDWYDLDPKHTRFSELTPPPLTATAFYYYDATLLAKTAALLGKVDEAQDYAARAERIRADFNRKFFDAAKGTYALNSQTGNAIPLFMGITEPADRARVLDAVEQDVAQRGYSMTSGEVGFRFLLQALAGTGHSDDIYRMVNQTDKPGYGFQIQKGETSLNESWDASNGVSHDHFMFGQITEWFYKDLAGIDTDPSTPGFKKIILHPAPVGDLAWVEASYNSVHGKISVRWEHQEGHFVLKTTIPANTTGIVFVPARENTPVTESDAPAEKSPGVTFLRREGDRMVYSIDSGSYQFASQF